MRKKVIFVVILISILLLYHPIRVRMENNENYKPLSGVTIVLDPGHGGKDNGAMSNEIHEQDINLKIAQKLQPLLEDAGANIIMTREGNYDLADDGAENRKKNDMKKRMEIINEEKTDIFLSIHLNAFPNTSVNGAQVFYKKGDENSKQLADLIQENLQDLTGTKMVTKTGDYYILNETSKTGALIECGFLSNSKDRANLIKESYQTELAKTIYDSLLEYLEILS